jgi:hypothetical protein
MSGAGEYAVLLAHSDLPHGTANATLACALTVLLPSRSHAPHHLHAPLRRYRRSCSRARGCFRSHIGARISAQHVSTFALTLTLLHSRAHRRHVRHKANRYLLHSGSKLAASPSVPTTTTCAPRPPLPTILKISSRVGSDINLAVLHACTPTFAVRRFAAGPNLPPFIRHSHHLTQTTTILQRSTLRFVVLSSPACARF